MYLKEDVRTSTKRSVGAEKLKKFRAKRLACSGVSDRITTCDVVHAPRFRCAKGTLYSNTTNYYVVHQLLEWYYHALLHAHLRMVVHETNERICNAITVSYFTKHGWPHNKMRSESSMRKVSAWCTKKFYTELQNARWHFCRGCRTQVRHVRRLKIFALCTCGESQLRGTFRLLENFFQRVVIEPLTEVQSLQQHVMRVRRVKNDSYTNDTANSL